MTLPCNSAVQLAGFSRSIGVSAKLPGYSGGLAHLHSECSQWLADICGMILSGTQHVDTLTTHSVVITKDNVNFKVVQLTTVDLNNT